MIKQNIKESRIHHGKLQNYSATSAH